MIFLANDEAVAPTTAVLVYWSRNECQKKSSVTILNQMSQDVVVLFSNEDY